MKQIENEVTTQSQKYVARLRRGTGKFTGLVRDSYRGAITTGAALLLMGFTAANFSPTIDDYVTQAGLPSITESIDSAKDMVGDITNIFANYNSETESSENTHDFDIPRASLTTENGLVKLVTSYDSGKQITGEDIDWVVWYVNGKERPAFPDENKNYNRRKIPRKGKHDFQAEVVLKNGSRLVTDTLEDIRRSRSRSRKPKAQVNN